MSESEFKASTRMRSDAAKAKLLNAQASAEEKRVALIALLVSTWNNSPEPAAKKVWSTVTTIMEFVGAYPGFAGADKRKLCLDTLQEFLKQTNSPGPDYVVDAAILWIVEYGVDALYEAYQGKFAFKAL